MSRFSWSRFFLIAFVLLLAGLIIVAKKVAGDPKGTEEYAASLLLKREVRFRDAKFLFTKPEHLEVFDLEIPNAVWGSDPNILRIDHLSADFDLRSFVFDTPIFENLTIDDAHLVLERDNDGHGNWKPSGALPSAPRNREDEAKRSREKFPDLLALSIRNSGIIFHTSGGAALTIEFKQLDLRTNNRSDAVLLTVTGAYNKIPVVLHISTGSFDALHDTSKPFEADIQAEGGDTKIHLEAKLTDPLNFDGVEGLIDVRISNLGRMSRFFGDGISSPLGLSFKSHFERSDDNWLLSQAKGSFASNEFAASQVKLSEGKRLEPDAVDAALNFKDFNVDQLKIGNADEHVPDLDAPIPVFDPEPKPSVLLKADVTAETMHRGSLEASKVRVEGEIKPGEILLKHVAADIFGGKLAASLSTFREKEGTKVILKGRENSADLHKILVALGVSTAPAEGPVTLAADLESRGPSWKSLEAAAEGTFIIASDDGELSERFFHLASLDARALLDDKKNMTHVDCFVAAAEFARGKGTLAPFRLKTANGTLQGTGTLDLPSGAIDLVFQADPHSTTGLALDSPIHLKGPLSSPAVVPEILGGKKDAARANAGGHAEPAAARDLIPHNKCYDDNAP